MRSEIEKLNMKIYDEHTKQEVYLRLVEGECDGDIVVVAVDCFGDELPAGNILVFRKHPDGYRICLCCGVSKRLGFALDDTDSVKTQG